MPAGSRKRTSSVPSKLDRFKHRLIEISPFHDHDGGSKNTLRSKRSKSQPKHRGRPPSPFPPIPSPLRSARKLEDIYNARVPHRRRRDISADSGFNSDFESAERLGPRQSLEESINPAPMLQTRMSTTTLNSFFTAAQSMTDLSCSSVDWDMTGGTSSPCHQSESHQPQMSVCERERRERFQSKLEREGEEVQLDQVSSTVCIKSDDGKYGTCITQTEFLFPEHANYEEGLVFMSGEWKRRVVERYYEKTNDSAVDIGNEVAGDGDDEYEGEIERSFGDDDDEEEKEENSNESYWSTIEELRKMITNVLAPVALRPSDEDVIGD